MILEWSEDDIKMFNDSGRAARKLFEELREARDAAMKQAIESEKHKKFKRKPSLRRALLKKIMKDQSSIAGKHESTQASQADLDAHESAKGTEQP